MIAQRLSIVLSVLAMCLMALACSLGWRTDRQAAPLEVVAKTGPTGRTVVDAVTDRVAEGATEDVAERCRRLDDRFLTCADELSRVWRPPTPDHYPTKVRRLLRIKRRYELESRAIRACRGDPDAPAVPADVQQCARRSACDEFAHCVADNFDPFE